VFAWLVRSPEFNLQPWKKIDSHSLGWLLSGKWEIAHVGKAMEKLEPLCTIDGIVKWFNCYKKLKIQQPYVTAFG
jgi:hypothetical protein